MFSTKQKKYERLLEAALANLETAPELYCPTNFWDHGVRDIIRDFKGIGLKKFKSWPSARYFFAPSYGMGHSNASIAVVTDLIKTRYPSIQTNRLSGMLTGGYDAMQDWEMTQIIWDEDNWPTGHDFGESTVGSPSPFHRPGGRFAPGVTKAFMNYKRLFALLSRHMPKVPETVLELGGGYGVAADVVFGLNPNAQYVDYDLPPLSIIAQYYLDKVHGGKNYHIGQSWELPAHQGPVDLFLNSFSLQEMEPHVVENYVNDVANIGADYIMSLNSTKGKPIAKTSDDIGVFEQVRSDTIEGHFKARGYETLARYGKPYQRTAATALIMKKSG